MKIEYRNIMRRKKRIKRKGIRNFVKSWIVFASFVFAGSVFTGAFKAHAAEKEKKKVIVYTAHIKGEDGKKVYDDSRYVELFAETQWEGGEPKEGQVNLEVRGYARSSDVGIWKVDVEYELTGPQADDYVLECRRTALETRVEIVPKILTVRIADAVKPYYSDMDVENLRFPKGEISVAVSGFMKNGAASDEAPAGFEMPKIALDKNILQKESPMYCDGSYVCYEKALTLEKGEEGAAGGLTNYCYAPEDERYTRKGNITLTEEQPNLEKIRISAKQGSAIWDEKAKKYCVAGNTILQVKPRKDSGYNQILESGILEGSGKWSFYLERFSMDGELLARSQRIVFDYAVDETPPDGRIFLNGRERRKIITDKICICSTKNVKDDFSEKVKIQWYISREKMDLEDFAADKAIWTEADSIQLTEEGHWYPYVRLRDQTGNTVCKSAGEVIIDRTPPRFSIEGAADNGILGADFKISVFVEDENANMERSGLRLYRKVLEKNKTGQDSAIKREVVSEKRIFLPVRKENNILKISADTVSEENLSDGWYILKLSAVDLAGNCGEKEISFSINQRGPRISINSDTEKFLSKSCVREGQDITFLVRDVNKIKNCRIVSICDGDFSVLDTQKDCCTSSRIFADGTWEYQYVIPGSYFEKEGTYHIVLSVRDEAGNEAGSDSQKPEMGFTIDRTAPVCLIYPLKQRKDKIKISVECEDNYRFFRLHIYRNEMLEKETENEKYEIELSFAEETKWRLEAYDTAGNREVRYISREELEKELERKELLPENAGAEKMTELIPKESSKSLDGEEKESGNAAKDVETDKERTKTIKEVCDMRRWKVYLAVSAFLAGLIVLPILCKKKKD